MTSSKSMSGAIDLVGDVAAAAELGADLVDDLAPDVADVAEAAVMTVAASGRLGFRLLKGTVRLVARRPREVLVAVVVIVVGVVVLRFVLSDSSAKN